MRRARSGSLLVGTVALIAAAAFPAGMASAAKLKTRTATTPLGGAGTTASAVATCPPRTRAVGGGFAVPILNISPGGSQPVTYESRRIGQRKWRASAAETANPGASVTSFVYCRSGVPRASTKTATATVPPFPGTTTQTSISARCPGRTKALSGGFAVTPTTTFLTVASENRRTGGNRWLTSAWSIGGTGAVTSYAYCVPSEAPKVRSRSGTIAGMVPAPHSQLSRRCPRPLKAGAGGYSAPAVFTGMAANSSLPIVYESRKSGGRRWLVSGTPVFGMGPGPFSVFAYCS